jgi:mannitol/fructose-specific phosphotransferase system IIA component (Ntr-type)
MTLAQFTEPKLLVPRLLSRHRKSAIIELSRRLENVGRIENADAFGDAALDHEAVASAVFDGVTFPLARGLAVQKLSFAAGLSQQGIRWGSGRSPVVHTVVLFAVPLLETRIYLSLVFTFSSFIKDEMAFTAFTRATQPEEMFAVFEAIQLVRLIAQPQPAAVG